MAIKTYTIFCLIVTFLSTKVDSQIWSGTIDYNKSSVKYQVKLSSNDKELQAFFSSTDLNAYEIPCQKTTLQKDTLLFYVVSDYYTYEYRYIKQEENFQGSLNIYSNETDQLLNSFETNLIRENTLLSEIVEKQELSFSSNELKLYGTLWKPKNSLSKGLFFVTSSQGNDRSANNAEANYFTNLGYTVFNYDKRGTGKSEGNWQTATIEELCADDMNAIAFFSKTAKLPLSEIGIKGSSQGGIKIPYILSKVPELKFGIAISCPGGTLLESDLNNWKNINIDQIGKENIKKATKVQKAGYKYLADDVSFKKLNSIKNKYNNQDWFKYVWVPEENIQKDYKLNFSGLPYFKKISQPILVIQGLSDKVIPENSYKVIENALKKSGLKKYEIVTFKNTTHSMTYVDNEYPYFQKLTKDYLPIITKWLQK